jgi:heme oxygenase
LNLYRIAMQCLQRAYRDIDSLLLQSIHLCPPVVPPYSPRVPGIYRDLLALNASPDEPPVTEPYSGLKAPQTEAAYLGMRYVVEGAQLGSRIVHNHLYTAFGDQLREFGSFWTPGSALQSSWPGVLKGLDRVDSRQSLADAVRSARLTFRHMELYLAPDRTGTS